MQRTVKEVVDRLKDTSQYAVTVYIHDGNSCGIYDEHEFHLIPDNLLNRKVLRHNIVRNKRIIHADLHV